LFSLAAFSQAKPKVAKKPANAKAAAKTASPKWLIKKRLTRNQNRPERKSFAGKIKAN
jgi:hypothetical protein